MSEHWGVPGIGGSLGKCAICGNCFAYEVITGEDVVSFHMSQFPATLYGHKKCADTLENLVKAKGKWQELPDGPIRQSFADAALKENP